MSTDDQSHDGHQQRRSRPIITFAANVYQQIAAIIGTFALIALLGHFVDFNWRGFMTTLVAQWDEFVRPAMKLLVTVPLGSGRWFGHRHVDVTNGLA